MGFRTVLEVAILVIATLSTVTTTVTTLANAQVVTLEPSQIDVLAPNTISLNISFANNTNATLDREPITEEQGNAIVAAVNAILLNDNEALEGLELLEEEEEDELDNGNDGNGGGNGNDNGDDNGDDVDEEVGEDTDDLLPIEEEEQQDPAEQELKLEPILPGPGNNSDDYNNFEGPLLGPILLDRENNS